MAKTTAPLLSFDASGAIGKSMVFAKWRGVGYSRRYVIPGNPQTTGQVLTRDIFANQGLLWKTGGPLMRAPWERFAVGQPFLGRNRYIGNNISVLRGESDMARYEGPPGDLDHRDAGLAIPLHCRDSPDATDRLDLDQCDRHLPSRPDPRDDPGRYRCRNRGQFRALRMRLDRPVGGSLLLSGLAQMGQAGCKCGLRRKHHRDGDADRVNAQDCKPHGDHQDRPW